LRHEADYITPPPLRAAQFKIVSGFLSSIFILSLFLFIVTLIEYNSIAAAAKRRIGGKRGWR